MKFLTILVTLAAFIAAHDGPHDAQGNALDNEGNLIGFVNGTKPAKPIPPSEQAKLFGNQQQKQYPLPSTQQQPAKSQNDQNPLFKDFFEKFMKYTSGGYNSNTNNQQQQQQQQTGQPCDHSNDNKPIYNQY